MRFSRDFCGWGCEPNGTYANIWDGTYMCGICVHVQFLREGRFWGMIKVGCGGVRQMVTRTYALVKYLYVK